MSIFDPPNTQKLSEIFPPGTYMMMYEASWEGTRDTSFGPSAQASVKVGPADRTGTPKWFRVFGNLAEQVLHMEPGDLPALVTVEQDGRRNQWGRVSAKGANLDDIPF